jgi:prolipoprotein diacylglyceryltransferase
MKPYFYLFSIEINLYKFFFGVALCSVPVVLFLLRKRFEFTKKQAAFYSGFTLAFGLVAAYLTAVFKKAMLSYAMGSSYVESEKLRNYGIPIFLPIFLFLYCIIRKEDFRKLSDYIAPCVYTVMTFVKTGCIFGGCCYGRPDEHGIWNENLGYRTFPVQLYDTMTSILIVIICIILIRKIREKRSGYIYPIGGILFALTKGFWEFFREHPIEQEKSYMNTGFTLWQYWMLALFIACVIWIVILRLREKSSDRK